MRETLFGILHLGPNLCTRGVSNLDHLQGILTTLSSGNSIGCVDSFLVWLWFQFDPNRSYFKQCLMGKSTSVGWFAKKKQVSAYKDVINYHGSVQTENCGNEISISLYPIESIGPTP